MLKVLRENLQELDTIFQEQLELKEKLRKLKEKEVGCLYKNGYFSKEKVLGMSLEEFLPECRYKKAIIRAFPEIKTVKEISRFWEIKLLAGKLVGKEAVKFIKVHLAFYDLYLGMVYKE